jgi:hypothetical protein
MPAIPTLLARSGHIMPGFTNNLLSLGKLCDADCTATMDKHKLEVHDKNRQKILHGDRELTGARNIAPQPTPSAATPPTPIPTVPLKPQCTATHREVRTLDLPSTPALIAYHHATAGYPVKQTWLDAIQRGAYKTWPGLTYKLVARHCPDADETLRGHMAQPRQHIRSTQPTV